MSWCEEWSHVLRYQFRHRELEAPGAQNSVSKQKVEQVAQIHKLDVRNGHIDPITSLDEQGIGDTGSTKISLGHKKSKGYRSTTSTFIISL